MFHRLLLLALPALLLLTACSRCGDGSGREGAPAAADTVPILVMQIQKCSRLYSSEYQLHKIVTFGDTLALSGSLLQHRFKINLPVGQRRVAIPLTATVKAYVDMGQLTERDIRRRGRRIELVLPDPQIELTATQIDHDAVRQRVSLLRSRFSDEELTRIQQQGREDIVRSLPRLGIVENARQNAARQLIPIVAGMGWRPEDVTVTFRKKFTPADLAGFIRKTE